MCICWGKAYSLLSEQELIPLRKLLEVIQDMITSNQNIKVRTEEVPWELRKEKERTTPARAGGPGEAVALNWILKAKWLFVALFCRSRELLEVSGQKSGVIKKHVIWKLAWDLLTNVTPRNPVRKRKRKLVWEWLWETTDRVWWSAKMERPEETYHDSPGENTKPVQEACGGEFRDVRAEMTWNIICVSYM